MVLNASPPPITILRARNFRPSDKLPVESFIQPKTNGLTKPDKLPIELIIAIPAAAAEPAKYAVSRLQNNASEENTPVAAIVIPSRTITR